METHLQKLINLKVCNQKYFNWYCKIMEKGIKRGINKKSLPYYTEKHHVYPKSLLPREEWKNNNNLVLLTLKEHMVAHKLLSRIFPHIKEIQRAYFAIFHARNKQQQKNIMNVRELLYFKSQSDHLFSRKGADNGMFGKTHSEKTKQLISEKTKDRKISEQTRNKFKENNSGKTNPFFGKTHSQETKTTISRKISKLSMGSNNPSAKRYQFISPEGLSYIIEGEFDKFCQIQSLSRSKMFRSINKGIIKNVTDQTKNCLRWSVTKLSQSSERR